MLIGLAGVGKTATLRWLAQTGHRVVDLEGLAGHRGSAFGGLGQPPQPSQASFDRAVRDAWTDGAYVEDEGAFIGSLSVPPAMVQQIETAPVIELVAPIPSRVARLVRDYGGLDPALLIRATQRLRRRLGGPVADRAISHFAAGRPDAAITALLPYFDAAYLHRARRLTRPVLARVDDDARCSAIGAGSAQGSGRPGA